MNKCIETLNFQCGPCINVSKLKIHILLVTNIVSHCCSIINNIVKMVDMEIFCNYKKCRKALTTLAWATRCSHAFCEEDAFREFEKTPGRNKCPVCNTPLTHKYDIVKANLNPSEKYKNMVLAGLRPEIIIDITNRAIAFWTYQMHHELSYQTADAKQSRSNMNCIEQHYKSQLLKLQNDEKSAVQEPGEQQKELEEMRRHLNELNDRLAAEQRKSQQFQDLYQSLRGSTLSSSMQNLADPRNDDCHHQYPFNLSQANEWPNFLVGPETLSVVKPSPQPHKQLAKKRMGLQAQGETEASEEEPMCWFPNPHLSQTLDQNVKDL